MERPAETPPETLQLANGSSRVPPQSAETRNFEIFLGELSASLVRVAAEQIDHEIERWVERIILVIGVDRGSVVQFESGDRGLFVTHQWGRGGVKAPDKGVKVDNSRFYPWLTRRTVAGELTVIRRLEDLPPEAARDLAAFRWMSTKSNVTIPLKVGGSVVGAVLFGTTFYERDWTQQDVNRLQLVAHIFGNAIERKRSEARMRRVSEELRKVSQIVSMGELTAALAHELNQPLTAILSNAKAIRRILAAQPTDIGEIEAATDDIVLDSGRAAEIVRDVRSLFKRTEGQKSPIDLRLLLLDTNRILTADAQLKGVSWTMELPDSLPFVSGDRTQLTHVVLNLAFNAFDAVCNGDGPREVSLRAARTETGCVRVSVRDSGTGIAATHMPRLFEPFFSTKDKGIGMGLAIVRSIIDNHRGRVWAVQNPDRGATFEFELPSEPTGGELKTPLSRTSKSD